MKAASSIKGILGAIVAIACMMVFQNCGQVRSASSESFDKESVSVAGILIDGVELQESNELEISIDQVHSGTNSQPEYWYKINQSEVPQTQCGLILIVNGEAKRKREPVI